LWSAFAAALGGGPGKPRGITAFSVHLAFGGSAFSFGG
jgi:hypothetical protein